MSDNTTPAPAAGEAQPISKVDAIIDAAVAETAAANADKTKEPTEGQPAEPKADDKPEDQFPKKAVNALSRRDKKIGRQEAEIARLREENERLSKTAPKATETAAPKSDSDPEPKESDFEGKTYGDYLKAVARWEARQESKTRDAQQAETAKESKINAEKAQHQEWVEEREAAVDENFELAKAVFPDIQAVMEENQDILKGFKPHVRHAVLEADNPAFALVMLAKEGKLEELNDMSHGRVAALIARMEDKGLALKKPQTKAPAPLPASRGSITPGKKPDDMDGKEIRAWMRST